MAKHFDSLVELTRSILLQKDRLLFPKTPDCAAELESAVREAALFELLFPPQQLAGDRNDEEYRQYLNDYFNESARNGSFFLTPFPVTAIEYQDAVFILKNIKANEYLLICCTCGRGEDQQQSIPGQKEQRQTLIMMGTTRIQRPDPNGLNELTIDVKPLLQLMSLGDTVRALDQAAIDRDNRKSEVAMVESVAEFMHGILFIMDPENFILRKESGHFRKMDRKGKTKKRDALLQKTVMRPHYVCMSEMDTADFLRNSAKEPRLAHPVRGHWRRLISEKFRNKQGQAIFIRQYFTGQGRIDSAGGWTYQVMVKPEFGKILPYEDAKE